MDWKTVKEMRFELEDRGFYIESITDKYIVVSKLKDNDSKLYYVYEGVYETDGKLKVFDLNIRNI